jgi:hypothetical protein
MVGAPYCGPPPHEHPYVARWRTRETDNPAPDWQLQMYGREEVEQFTGIQDVAALPTGLIMYDMRVFDLWPVPYFEYQWSGDGLPCERCGERKPGPRAKKSGTEDVVLTRNISLIGQRKLGYNPCKCNWDAWAGHWKPKLVRKPRSLPVELIERRYAEAVLAGRHVNDVLLNVGDGKIPEGAPPMPSFAPSNGHTEWPRYESTNCNHED